MNILSRSSFLELISSGEFTAIFFLICCIAELPLPRVQELRTLAAASVRNHQKIHPARHPAVASSNRASVSHGELEEEGDNEGYGERIPNHGDAIHDEHRVQTTDDDPGEFPQEEEIGGTLGTSHPPSCAGFSKFYCDASDDYPT